MDSKLLLKLAGEYGTPLYVYDGDKIIEQYKGLYSLIKWPKLKIFYAMKANYNVAILNLLKDNGAHLDTVSPAEVLLALELGFPKERILYTANNMTDDEMDEVKKYGVLFNIDSLSRLEKYGSSYPKTDICLRFNPDVVAGENEKVQTAGALTKFGILMDDVKPVKKITGKYNLKVVGLHEHTGSGIADTEKVYQSMRNLLNIAEHFPELKFVDFGGGFKVTYNPHEKKENRVDYVQFGKKITDIFSDFCKKYSRSLEMYFEPGKYIVAESGYLILQVNTLKSNKGRLIAGTDSGFMHLIRPVLYNAYHHIINLSNSDGKINRYDICGNICETGDCFAVDREIAEIRENDFLAVLNAGAYCYSMAGVYNLRPLPSEILVSHGKTQLVTKRLKNNELVKRILNDSR